MRLTMSCVERPNCVPNLTTVSETVKKSIASQTQASQLYKRRSKGEVVRSSVDDATHPVQKRPHCVQVISLTTSRKGLDRPTLSLFGTRFRRKYGSIGGNEGGETERGRVAPQL